MSKETKEVGHCIEARNELCSLRKAMVKGKPTILSIKALNAATNAVGREVATAKLQLEYAKIMQLEPNIDYIKLPENTELLNKGSKP